MSIGQSAGTGRWRGWPWVTLTLAAVLAGVHAALVTAGPVDVDALVRWGAKSGPLVVEAGQAWRLVTANFLHRDWGHLGLNLLVLVAAGAALERACWRWDYAALLGAAGLATMAGSLGWSAAVSVGASGLVYACVGALLVMSRRYRGRPRGKGRWLTGDGALPTVLVFLWMGWTVGGRGQRGAPGRLAHRAAGGGLPGAARAGQGAWPGRWVCWLAATVVAALVVGERS
ncbi:rhomboid family intramembrane serine protease, partial [Pyxidicoccus sp. 3LFB2]